MRVVALLAIRNEELYLERTLTHLHAQGIETCIIDNDSTDASLEIARSFRGKGVFRIESLPFRGSCELLLILKEKERLAREIEADWFIHYDADEIRQAPAPFKTLLEGICEVERRGYNAINFDEFVFLPTDASESYEGTDFVANMRYYYFFQPLKAYRIKAWKRNDRFDLASSGGHRVQFPGRKVYPENFILRHYIFLSKEHAIRKYIQRVYSEKAIKEFGWHKVRANLREDMIILPDRLDLNVIRDDGYWDRSKPTCRHLFIDAEGKK